MPISDWQEGVEGAEVILSGNLLRIAKNANSRSRMRFLDFGDLRSPESEIACNLKFPPLEMTAFY